MGGNLWDVSYNGKPASPVVAADVTDALDWAETCLEDADRPVVIEVRYADQVGTRTVEA